MNKILKILSIFITTLILTACGGGGGSGSSGGGGSAGAGVGTGTVTMCTDSGTDYQTTEYNRGSVYLSQKSRRVVCASSAYARGATGSGIQVAVIDTGVDADHSDINDNMVAFTTGSDVVNSDNDASDDEGHGSHVAGIIAAEKNNSGMHGIAYDADIYAFKAFNSSGVAPAGATGSAYGLVEAIGAIDIINNSWELQCMIIGKTYLNCQHQKFLFLPLVTREQINLQQNVKQWLTTQI